MSLQLSYFLSIRIDAALCTVEPLILTAALPALAVTINSFPRPFLLNQVHMASISVLFPVPPAPPSTTETHEVGDFRGLGYRLFEVRVTASN